MENQLYEAKRFANLREILKNTVELYGKSDAFVIKKKNENGINYEHITYQMFNKEIDALGTAFINMGLKGKRIAIIAPNRYEWCTTYLATLNGVGIVVPLDKSLPEQEIALSLERSYADVVVFDGKYLEAMKEIKKNQSNIKYFISMDETKENDFIYYQDLVKKGKEKLKQGDTSYQESEIRNEEMSIILFTSGTTSAAKAVMLSHKNIAENIYALNSIVKIYDTDTSLAFLPFHHTFGSTGYLFFMSNGATTVFCDGLRHIQQNLKEYQVTVFVCVPLLLEAMYKKINKEIEKQGKAKVVHYGKKVSDSLLKIGIDVRRKLFREILEKLGGNLRLVVSGAAAIDKEVAKGFNSFGITTIQGYGLTETSPVLTAENSKHIRYGSVGFPMINVEIAIDQPDQNGIGEIKAKGPNVMSGYYENPEATQEVLKDGWFYTGDLGYIDKDGYLFITGRRKNVIVLKNGKNIFPEEIELLINNLPYVAESMVFGMPKEDDYIPAAKIVYQKEYIEDGYPKITKQELEEKIWKDIKKINQGLTNFKHIKKIIITDEPMIKTTTQKIKRFEEINNLLR